MDSNAPLPEPAVPELERLVPNPAVRVVYKILYEHRGEGISMLELRRLAAPLLIEVGLADQQEQLDRRKRDLHPLFVIDKVRSGTEVRHRLVGRRSDPLHARGQISAKTRAIVLQPARCAMCGQTPLEDGVKLVVDHKIPLEWGGTNDIDNLQPLCEECNSGKKAHFAAFEGETEAIRKAVAHDEPHRRIGELLKALQGQQVRSDLIGMVASAKTFQEDWQKRLRELRTLGWQIESGFRNEAGRRWTYYELIHWEPWPAGSIRAEIARRERAGKQG